MTVKLISVTQPRVDGITTAEELIVYCARVSNPSNQLNLDTGAKLLRYCIEHEHWSIFEQASMTVEVTTSRAIAAQILRHRSFAFQEFSQRYSEVQYMEAYELRQQAAKNRQSSTELMASELYAFLANQAVDHAQQVYNQLIDAGVARECARMVLPLCTQTTLYMTGSVRSWIHYLKLRTKQDTQKEHRDIAMEISAIFREQFPVTSGAALDCAAAVT
jgi:thymidylate synthase (FAD)